MGMMKDYLFEVAEANGIEFNDENYELIYDLAKKTLISQIEKEIE